MNIMRHALADVKPQTLVRKGKLAKLKLFANVNKLDWKIISFRAYLYDQPVIVKWLKSINHWNEPGFEYTVEPCGLSDALFSD